MVAERKEQAVGSSSEGTWWESGDLERSVQPEWEEGRGQEATWLAG